MDEIQNNIFLSFLFLLLFCFFIFGISFSFPWNSTLLILTEGNKKHFFFYHIFFILFPIVLFFLRFLYWFLLLFLFFSFCFSILFSFSWYLIRPSVDADQEWKFYTYIQNNTPTYRISKIMESKVRSLEIQITDHKFISKNEKRLLH